MSLPRWTIWPAFAVLCLFLVGAVPKRVVDPNAGAAAAARAGQSPSEPHKRVIVLGIDGLDPELLAETVRLYPERMKNFAALMAEGDGIQSLGTSTPPQSPVAWSNFITGLDPGGHGSKRFFAAKRQWNTRRQTEICDQTTALPNVLNKTIEIDER